MTQTPLNLYRQKLDSGDIAADPTQQKAVAALQEIYESLTSHNNRHSGESRNLLAFWRKKPGRIKGLYMHGGVGRGKSMLMDLFYDALPDSTKKRRVHFHAFMIETHDWMHKRRGKKMDNLLPTYAAHVAKETRVLCFDEFHVTDVADAMILGRLFTALFEKGVVVVATSNWPPDKLYTGGLQRDRFLPFIALLKERMTVLHLDGATDYRTTAREEISTYFSPLGKAAEQEADNVFAGLTDCADSVPDTIIIKGREIIAERTAGGVARFTFAQLCEQPHGAEDYIAIAQKYDAVFIEGIPKLGYDRRNEAKRLMTLIDALYEERTKVIITADVPPDKLYQGSDHAFEFDRTISRLTEMQGRAYWEQIN